MRGYPHQLQKHSRHVVLLLDMALVRYSYRGYKFIRNAGLVVVGIFFVLLSLILPRILGQNGLGISGVAQADAPGGGGGGGDGGVGDGGGGGSGGSSCGGGGMDACGDGGDCSY